MSPIVANPPLGGQLKAPLLFVRINCRPEGTKRGETRDVTPRTIAPRLVGGENNNKLNISSFNQNP